MKEKTLAKRRCLFDSPKGRIDMLKLSKKKILGLMLEQRLSVSELAKRAGVSLGVVSGLLKRDSNCTIPVAAKIADALGVSPSQLLTEED
jgi:transcriptional regulator with XRE-family HTH domain